MEMKSICPCLVQFHIFYINLNVELHSLKYIQHFENHLSVSVAISVCSHVTAPKLVLDRFRSNSVWYEIWGFHGGEDSGYELWRCV